MPVTASELQKLKPLQGVPVEELAPLLALATEQSFKAGEVVFRAGDTADHALLLVSGRLAASVSSSAGERPIGDIWPGELVGETALFEAAAVRNATVTAMGPSVAIVVDKKLLEEARGGMALAVMQRHVLAVLARRIRSTNLGIRKAWQEQRAAAASPAVQPPPAAPPRPRPAGPAASGSAEPTLKERLSALFGGLF